MKRPITARAPTDAQLAALEAETRPTPRERPLIVRAEEVSGLLDGSVTQVWRPTRKVPDAAPTADVERPGIWYADGGLWLERSPFGSPGDRLWCRETWTQYGWNFGVGALRYRADYGAGVAALPGASWHAPVSMPRWACRAVVEVTGLEVRRVSTATNADAEAAGFRGFETATRRGQRFTVESADDFRANWSKRYPGAEWAWVATVRRVSGARCAATLPPQPGRSAGPVTTRGYPHLSSAGGKRFAVPPSSPPPSPTSFAGRAPRGLFHRPKSGSVHSPVRQQA